MAATGLNINKTDVYYTLINNEVYALRFKAILVDIPSLSERELCINKNDTIDDINRMVPVILRGNNTFPSRLNKSKMVLFDKQTDRKYSHIGINYIIAEIAPLGEERVWKKYGNDPKKTFNPYKIYRTIKDCVDDVNPVFVRHHNEHLWPTQAYAISLDEITPDQFVWEDTGTPNIYGLLVWRLKTWTWNGYRACKDNVYTVNNRMGYYNSYNYPLFDLLDGKFLFDEDLLEHSYSTEEECHKYNSIAVHLFINQ